MKTKLLITLFVCMQLLFSGLQLQAASPIFEPDKNYPNLWIVNEATGEITSYNHNAGEWVDEFYPEGSKILALQPYEHALINNLTNSSTEMSAQLATISIAGLGYAEMNTATDTGSAPLLISPNGGSYTETVVVEMSIDAALAPDADNAAIISWQITGAKTVTINSSAKLFAEQGSMERLTAQLYLIENDTYTINVELRKSSQLIASRELVFTLNSEHPDGFRRDTDLDGLPDLVELGLGLDPLSEDWQTDSDHNGWSNFDEWIREDTLDEEGIPLDSDNDGWPDFDEYLRETDPADDVTELSGSTAPDLGTVEYEQQLLLFKERPAATNLYEVEYVVTANLTAIVPDTQWQSNNDALISYVPGEGTVFNSDKLLTKQQLLWANSGSETIHPSRKLSTLQTDLKFDSFPQMRLPAGKSQIIDIRGTNSRTIDSADGTVDELRNWHLMKWLNSYPDLIPINFPGNTSWTTADEWKTAYITYLSENIVQEQKLTIDQSSTTDVALLLTVLATEYELAGNRDLPKFKQQNARMIQAVSNLKNTLGNRENNRTLDKVFLDLEKLSSASMPLEVSTLYLQDQLTLLPWSKDSNNYLFERLQGARKVNDQILESLIYMSRFSLFEEGANELISTPSLAILDVDTDSDGTDNELEVSRRVFAETTYPWLADTDADGTDDFSDPCPNDPNDLCTTITPSLMISSSFEVTVSDDGSYLIITAQLNRISDLDISVDYELVALTGDTATAGEDFEALSGTILIPAGQLTATILVSIPANTAGESTETFHLVLNNEVNLSLSVYSYLITLNSSVTNNANLTNLVVSEGSLIPGFSSNTLDYNVSVTNAVDSIRVSPTLEDGNATVEVNNVSVSSGQPSQAIALDVGTNVITVTVTSADQTIIKTYTVTVERGVVLSNDADLSNLSLSTGSLTPVFSSAVISYTSNVDFVTTSIAVTPTVSDTNASITVNGLSTASASASASISLDEGVNTIEVNVLAEDGNTSKTYTIVITRQAAKAFVQEAYFRSSLPENQDWFGYSVALSGNTMAVGTMGEDSNATGVDGDQTDNSISKAGAVYVFVRDINDVWTQQAYIKSSNPDVDDGFGFSLSLSGDTLAVTALGEASNSVGVNGDQTDNSMTNAGAVYVYTRSSDTWSQQAYIKASNTDANDNFGYETSIDGDTLVVGAWGEGSSATGIDGDQTNNSASNAGAVYVFTRSGSDWSQQAYIKASNAESGDSFGRSVSISDDTIAVGAIYEDSGTTGINGDGTDNSVSISGAAYVFTRSSGIWSEQAYIKASNTGNGDWFGMSIAISGDTLAVGANGEASNATGIDGDQMDDSVSRSGAAYIYTRTGGVWSQQAYIKASNPDASDQFGRNLDLSGNILVVAADYEDSNASGIDGDQSNNTITSSGALYAFVRDNNGAWSQRGYLKASNPVGYAQLGWSVAVDGDTIAAGSPSQNRGAPGINGDQNCCSVGTSGAVYTYKPLADAKLSGLELSSGTLSPAFHGNQLSYTASVGFATDSITLTATLSDTNATASINDIDATSGVASSAISLVEGENSIDVVVLGEDEIATKTYNIIITRQASSEFAQQAYIKASNTDSSDYFGDNDIAIFGDTMAIGATGEDSHASGINGNQGNSSAISSGAVYVFTRDSNNVWTQQAYIKASNPSYDDYFGWSIELSADTLVVGAYGEDSPSTGINGEENGTYTQASGAVYVFTRSAGEWSQQAFIKASNTEIRDNFGSSLSLSGDTLAVGAPGEDSGAIGINGDQSDNSKFHSGAVYIFTRSGTVWSQQSYIKASNSDVYDSFGQEISIDGDMLAVSAPYEESAATGINGDQTDNSIEEGGAVYVFERSGSEWSQQAYIKPSNFEEYDTFGISLALSGNTLAAGSLYESSNATGVNGDPNNNLAHTSGAVYIFENDGFGNWTEQAYIKASNTESRDEFGSRLALSGDRLAISALEDASSATGINGDQTDNATLGAGAVYYFTRIGNSWSQQAYIKASTANENYFGSAVAIDGQTIVIGATYESSNAVGINGDQTDTSESNSGAVYVFKIP